MPNAARASAWMLWSSLGAKTLSFGVQIGLGYLLLPAAFGRYAVIAGLLAVAEPFRDGAVRDHLIRTAARPGTRAADVALATAIWSNLAVAAALCALAVPLAAAFGDPGLTPLIVVAALAFPAGSHWGVAAGLLQSEFQFQAAARIYLAQAAVQAVASIVLAAGWRSAMALVAALALGSLATSVLGIRSCGLRVLPRRDCWAPGRALAWRTKWLMAGTLFAALLTAGDYLGLGLVWSSALLGVYYFGFQIPAQVGTVASSVGQVLLASLTRARAPEARRELLVRGTRTLGYLAAGASFAVVLALPYAERAIWAGRWAAAVPVGQVVALLLPLRLLYVVSKMHRLAAGDYRRWAVEVGCAGSGLVVVAVGTGALTERVVVVAAATAAYLAAATLLLVGAALRGVGLSRPRVLATLLGPYAVAAALAAPPYALAPAVPPAAGRGLCLALAVALPAGYLLLLLLAIRLVATDLWRATRPLLSRAPGGPPVTATGRVVAARPAPAGDGPAPAGSAPGDGAAGSRAGG